VTIIKQINKEYMVCVPFEATGMDLEGIMLSEISQTEKDNHHMMPLINEIFKK